MYPVASKHFNDSVDYREGSSGPLPLSLNDATVLIGSRGYLTTFRPCLLRRTSTSSTLVCYAKWAAPRLDAYSARCRESRICFSLLVEGGPPGQALWAGKGSTHSARHCAVNSSCTGWWIARPTADAHLLVLYLNLTTLYTFRVDAAPASGTLLPFRVSGNRDEVERTRQDSKIRASVAWVQMSSH